VADEEAWAVGLTCGGTLDVFVERLDPEGTYQHLRRCLREARPAAVATIVRGPGTGTSMVVESTGEVTGSLGQADLERVAAKKALRLLDGTRPGWMTWGEDASATDVFLDVHLPPPRLVIVGAVHVAIPLVSVAGVLGFRTTVVDPRTAFATRERFPHADDLISKWPRAAFDEIGIHEGTYVAVLSHDPKLDVPALKAALASPARYVGVLGSRKTHAKRVSALKEAGLGDDQLARLRAPIGLDLGGNRPEEIAVAIVAEMLAETYRPPSPDRRVRM
jgi:xanthine dehydrogenase accessory factor